jgi:hypothetical protein
MDRSRSRRTPGRRSTAVGLVVVSALLSSAFLPYAAGSDRTTAGEALPSTSCPAPADHRLPARLLHTLPTGPATGPDWSLRILSVRPDALAELAQLTSSPRAGMTCADGVVVADGEDVTGRSIAAAAAVERGLPLIVASASGGASLPSEAIAGGSADPSARPKVVLVGVDDTIAQADVVVGAAEGWFPVLIGPGDLAPRIAEVLAPLAGRDVRWTASSLAEARLLDEARQLLADAGVEVRRYDAPIPDGPLREVWLGDVRTSDAALMAAATAAQRGAAFIAVDGAELRSGSDRTGRIRDAVARLEPGGRIVLVGATTDTSVWQLETILSGTPLPDGGFLPLEDRRIVALYGSPDARGLGLLGEQDDAATVARAKEFARRYDDAEDGRTAVAGLDVIATIASSAAEPTGDFSRRVPIERLRPLIELAGEEGLAVLLDLQPGRTSFLEQALEYEELLRHPHVHLALDPEWRIGPNERHLVRIGSVSADEVQGVVDWLAALVRRERLPQKVLVLHQFTAGMLPDRDSIVIPSELIGVIHVDGQGPLPTKDRTYAALTAGAAEHWEWGWKNFTRIDTPVASPQQSLARLPVPVIVTYQ